MYELCTHEPITVLNYEGGQMRYMGWRYREFAVIKAQHYRLVFVPIAGFLADVTFATQESAIECMIEIDKLRNHWLGLEDSEWKDLFDKIIPILRRFALPFDIVEEGITVNPETENQNGYGQ